MSTHTTRLLRRAFAGLGAALALVATQALAQGTVTLTGAQAGANSCSYTEMKVTPNGNIQVTCTGGNQAIANFALSHASSASGYVLAPNTSTSAIVSRTGGDASQALMVMYSVQGNGCASSQGGIMLNAGGSQTIPFTIGAAGSTCTVSIALVSGTTGTVSPSTLTFTAQTGTVEPPPPPPPSGCPAPVASSINGAAKADGDKGRVIDISDFQGVTNTYGVPSGTIIYWPVPTPTTSVKAGFSQGQTARTPPSPFVEYQVSRCPGVFLDASQVAPACRPSRQWTGNQSELTIWTAPAAGFDEQSDFTNPTICYAPIGAGTYYINVRTTYTSCPYTASGGCGFSYRWNQFGTNSQF